jgi:hypothetical protein
MATRMQQRRGTAAQWTAANPVLAAGEIGFETDTNKFKMGNGTSTWSALQYFANAAELETAINNLIDAAPETLNTLNELAAALGDNPDFLSLYATNQRVDLINVTATGALQEARDYFGQSLLTHTQNTINVHGIADTAEIATKEYADNSVLAHKNLTENIHGIADTSALALTADVNTALGLKAPIESPTFTGTVSGITKAMVGLGNVDDTADEYKPVSAAQASAIDTAKTEAITAAGQAADDKISVHNLDETNVHGIADTSLLVTQTDLTNAISGATVDQSTLAGTGIDWNSVDNRFDIDNTVATTSYVDTSVNTHASLTENVHGITNTAELAYKNAANQTFTGNMEIDGNLVVDGNITVNGGSFNASATSIVIEDNMVQLAHQNAANTVDLGLVVAYNDGQTGYHAGIVRDVSDSKWKLFKDVTTEPATTVDFTQGSLDALAVGALEATTVTPSSGIVFSDGTQTKVGVPSITTFATAISSSATLAAGEADKFVPLTGAVTITLPASGYSTGQSIDFYQESGTGAQFSSSNGVVGTPGLKFRTTNSVATAMKTPGGWLVFGDLSA